MPNFFEELRTRLNYVISLPERTIRSLAAVAGGTTSLLTETLLPDSLRGTTFYRVMVGDMQRFVIEKVAQIQKTEPSTDAIPADDPQYLQKKMVGSALETAGLFAMHFSPLWVFAIAGDAAAGGSTFLQRLTERLKANNVLAPDAHIDNLTDLLASMQETSRKTAAAIDTPPLTRIEISQLAIEMTESYKHMFVKSANLVPRIETIWNQMNAVASRENISLERLGGILTVDVAQWGRKGYGAAMAVGQTGADLFGEKILDSYGRTLDAVRSEGVTGYLNNRLKSFLQSAADHFDPKRKTWTEQILNRSPEAADQSPSEPSPLEPMPPPPVVPADPI